MSDKVRQQCRERARELDITGLARQCLMTSRGAVSAYYDEARKLLIQRTGREIKISHEGYSVFRQDGSDISTFHDGAWVLDLKAVARERHIAANFSC